MLGRRFYAWCAVSLCSVFVLCRTSYAEETLIFGSAVPPAIHINARMLTPWGERVNEQGAGVLKLDIRHGPPLITVTNFYDRILNDVVQISFGSLNTIAGKFVRTLVPQLPYVAENSELGSVAFWRLYKSGVLNSEFDDMLPLFLCIYSQTGIHLTKPPQTLENLNGLKLAVNSKIAGDIASSLGAAPIALPSSDLYPGMQRGIVNGALTSWTNFQPQRLAEVTNFHVDTQLGVGTGAVLMARKRYNALSEAARKIIDANSGEIPSRQFGQFWDAVATEARREVAAMPNHQIVDLSPSQAETWKSATLSVVRSWEQETPDGADMLKRFREIYAGVKAGR